jgi:hypothetical protein
MMRGVFRLYSFAVLLSAAVLSGLVILAARWVFRGSRGARGEASARSCSPRVVVAPRPLILGDLRRGDCRWRLDQVFERDRAPAEFGYHALVQPASELAAGI